MNWVCLGFVYRLLTMIFKAFVSVGDGERACWGACYPMWPVHSAERASNRAAIESFTQGFVGQREATNAAKMPCDDRVQAGSSQSVGKEPRPIRGTEPRKSAIGARSAGFWHLRRPTALSRQIPQTCNYLAMPAADAVFNSVKSPILPKALQLGPFAVDTPWAPP